MGWTGSERDRYVELDGMFRVVILRGPRWSQERFLARGYREVSDERRHYVVAVALWEVEFEEVQRFWRCLYGPYVQGPARPGLVGALWNAIDAGQVTVLQREKPRPSPQPSSERKAERPTVVRRLSCGCGYWT